MGQYYIYLRLRLPSSTLREETCGESSTPCIPCNGTICPMVIDKIQPNRTNRIKWRCPMVILPVHGSLHGRTLPLHGIGRSGQEILESIACRLGWNGVPIPHLCSQLAIMEALSCSPALPQSSKELQP